MIQIGRNVSGWIQTWTCRGYDYPNSNDGSNTGYYCDGAAVPDKTNHKWVGYVFTGDA